MYKTISLIIVVLLVLASQLSGCASQPGPPSPEIQSLITRANSGDVDAQFRLGSAYDSGDGVRRDAKQAEKWYRMAADAGNAEAQNSMGSISQADGRYNEASIWYEKAYRQNHALATNNLGYLYDLGLGVPQDRQKGFELYSRAADLGWAEAMFNIGQMYGSGQLGPTDMIKGCIWTIRALKYSEGHRVKRAAAATVNYCKQHLSKEDYEKADQEANSWAPKEVHK